MSKLRKATDMLGITNPYLNNDQVPDIKPSDLGQKKALLFWEAVPSVPKTKTNPRLKKTLAIVGVVVALLLVIMQEFWLILVVASIFFVSYAMSSIPEQKIRYELNTHGLDIAGQLTYWHDMKQFFFTSSYSREILAIDVRGFIQTRLFITFKEGDRDTIKKICSERITYLDSEPKAFLDDIYRRALDKFDIEGNKA